MRTREDLEALGLTEDEINEELNAQAENGDTSAVDGGEEGQQQTQTDQTPPPDPAAPTQEPAAVAQPQPAPQAPAPAPQQPQPASAAPVQQPQQQQTEIRPAEPTEAEKRATRTQAIDTQLDELAAKFDNAEITAAEYRAAVKPLETEQRQIQRAEIEESTVERIQNERLVASWTTEVGGFIRDHPAYQPGTLAFETLDNAVKREQELAAREGRGQHTRDVLERAHAAVQAAFGVPAAAPKPAADPAAAPTQSRPQVQAPPTLATMPKAAMDDIQVGEFAHLDRLAANTDPDDPEAYERALAKLSPEQYNRYMASA